MTHTALSDCSYPESTAYNIRDEINATITRLKAVIDEETTLRRALRTLFVKRKREAIEQVRLANLHLDLVNEEEAAFCDDLKHTEATANERLNNTGCPVSAGMDETSRPTLSPMVTEMRRSCILCGKNTDDGRDKNVPPRHQIGCTCWSCGNVSTSPGRSTRSLDPPSPRRSPLRVSNDPAETPIKSTDDNIHSFATSTTPSTAYYMRPAYGPKPNMSPARSIHAMPPVSPAYSMRGFGDGPIPISAAPLDSGFPKDPPPASSAPSLADLGLDQRSQDPVPVQDIPEMTENSLSAGPIGHSVVTGTDQSVPPATALPVTFSPGAGGFGINPTTNPRFGFGGSLTNTSFGFGANPTPKTSFTFGGCSQPPSTSFRGTTGFGLGGKSQTFPVANLAMRPYDLIFGSNVSSFGAITHPILEPQEEASVVIARPKKKKRKESQPEPAPVGDICPPDDPPIVPTSSQKRRIAKESDGIGDPALEIFTVPSVLEQYLSEEEASLSISRELLGKHKENAKALLRVIESFENPSTVTTEPLQKGSGNQDERAGVNDVNLVKSNGLKSGDIALLKDHLEAEESKVQRRSAFIQELESKIALYRRINVASSS